MKLVEKILVFPSLASIQMMDFVIGCFYMYIFGEPPQRR